MILVHKAYLSKKWMSSHNSVFKGEQVKTLISIIRNISVGENCLNMSMSIFELLYKFSIFLRVQTINMVKKYICAKEGCNIPLKWQTVTMYINFDVFSVFINVTGLWLTLHIGRKRVIWLRDKILYRNVSIKFPKHYWFYLRRTTYLVWYLVL